MVKDGSVGHKNLRGKITKYGGSEYSSFVTPVGDMCIRVIPPLLRISVGGWDIACKAYEIITQREGSPKQ